MAGQEGLEPPAAGFGVRSSTIRATGLCPAPYPAASPCCPLRFGLFVHRVFTTEPAILIKVQLIGRVPLILGR